MPAQGQCEVTPGITLTADTALTSANLNLLGSPSVTVADGAIGADQLDRAGVVEVLGSGASGYNYLDNPNFAENRWSRGSTAVSCPLGVATFRADQWWATPAGAPITYERVQDGPDLLSVHSALLTGDTSVTTVDFGQDIPRRIASALAQPLVLSFYIYNATGAALTPLVRIDTCNSADDFSAMTNRFSQAVDSVSDLTWAKIEIEIDATAFANMANGMQVLVRLPSGAMSANTKSVRFSQMKLEAATGLPATPFVVEREAEEDDGSADDTVRNLLVNGLFEGARFLFPGTSGPTCSAGIRTVNAEGWWVAAAGASTLTYTRSSAAPATGDGASGFAAYSAKLTGAASITTVDFGQALPASQASLLKQDVVLSLWAKYTDGAAGSITPHLFIDTCDSLGSFAALTNRVDAELQACADGTWTRLTYQFDGSAITNLGNGARIYLHLASGDLDAGTKTIEIAEALLEVGVAASTVQPYLEPGLAAFAEGSFRGLVVDRSATGTARINADEIVMRHIETGRPIAAAFANVTAADGVSGAGGIDSGSTLATGWWYLWAIHNGTTASALLSQSATAPTMPAGYVYRALVSALYATDANTLRDFYQQGKTVFIDNVDFINATLTTSYADTDLSTAVAPNAGIVFGIFGTTSANNLCGAIASSSAGLHAFAAVCPDGAQFESQYRAAMHFAVPLRTAQHVWVKSVSTAATYKLRVRGYILK